MTEPTRQSRWPWLVLLVGSLAAGAAIVLLGLERMAPNQPITSVLWTTALAITAAATCGFAGQRDVVSWSTLMNAGLLSFAAGLFTWMFPFFTGDRPAHIGLTAVGAGLGLATGAIVILTTLRRPPTGSTAAFVLSAAAVTSAPVVSRLHDLLGAMAVSVAVLTIAMTWSSSAQIPAWSPPERRLRGPRWILSLLAAGVAGYAVERSLIGDRGHSRMTLGLATLVVLLALVSVLTSRREIPSESGAFSNWVSWRKEGRSGDFERPLRAPVTMMAQLLPPPTVPGQFRCMTEWSPSGTLQLADETFWSTFPFDRSAEPGSRAPVLGAVIHPDDRRLLNEFQIRGARELAPLQTSVRLHTNRFAWERFELTGFPSENGTYLVEFAATPDAADPTASARAHVPPLAAVERHPFTGLATAASVEQWLTAYRRRTPDALHQAWAIVVEVVTVDIWDQTPAREAALVLAELGGSFERLCRPGEIVAHLDGPYLMWLGYPLEGASAFSYDADDMSNRLLAIAQHPINIDHQVFTTAPRSTSMPLSPGHTLDHVLDSAASALTS